jgi:hypothetical protein
MEHSPRWDFRDRVTKPVLAINTSRNSERRRRIHDEVFTDLEYVEMEQVGHFLHMEKPTEVNAKLMEFINKVAVNARMLFGSRRVPVLGDAGASSRGPTYRTCSLNAAGTKSNSRELRTSRRSLSGTVRWEITGTFPGAVPKMTS